MQKFNTQLDKSLKNKAPSLSGRNFATNPIGDIREIHKSITNEQIAVLEDAIKQYKRLEEIKKYTSMVLKEIEMIDEKQLQRETAEIEQKLKKEADIDIEKLLESENFLEELYADGFDI